MPVFSDLPTGKSGGVNTQDSQTIAEIKQQTTQLVSDTAAIKGQQETASQKIDSIFTGSGMEGKSLFATGIAPDNMKEIVVVPRNGAVKIRFTPPADTVIDGQTICTVKGVKVVMKEGGFPQNENDGETVLVCEDNNMYSYTDEAYLHEGLTNDTEYFFGFFPYSTHGVYNRSTRNRKNVTPKERMLFGFRIDKNNSDSETRVEYLEMAVGMKPARMNFAAGKFDYGDWKDVWFVEDNKPYMVRSDGTVDYQLNPVDYSKKITGEDSDVDNANYDGNAMASFPTVWLKQWDDGTYEYCYFSDTKIDDDYHAYAHQRADGSIMEYKYLRMFGGSLINGKLRSLSGKEYIQKNTAQQEVAAATANGSLWYTTAKCEWNLIDMLTLLMSKHDDRQDAFGKGNLNYQSGDTTKYGMLSTGTLNTKGQFFGYNDLTHQVKVFHIEKPWADQWERYAGHINDKGAIKVKMYPPYNFDGAGYANTSTTMSGTNGGYISVTKMTEWGRLPVVISGAEGQGVSDGGWFNNSQVNYALGGGYCGHGLRCGPSCCTVSDLVSHVSWHIGAGLSLEQPKTA